MDTKLNIWVSEELKEEIKKHCDKTGLSISSFVRYCVKKELANA